MKTTTYNSQVSKLQKPFTVENLEIAIREHLAIIHDALTTITPRNDILSAYGLKFLAWNLKTILKSKARGTSSEEVTPHINLFAEELAGRRDVIVRALSARDLDEAVNELKGTEFGEEIEIANKIYRAKNELMIFDAYIDKAYYRNLVSKYSDTFGSGLKRTLGGYEDQARDIIAVDVDSYNTVNMLRAKIWELPASQVRDLIVDPIFDVSQRILEKMIASETINDAVRSLVNTPYRGIVPPAGKDTEVVSALEDGFALLSFRRASKPFLWNVFGIGLALGIVKLKELEARNLAAIAFGVDRRIGSQNIIPKLTVLP